MTALLKAIHVGRRQLGLEDDDYRALLERVTGKRSAGDLDTGGRKAVLEEMRRLGFTAQPGTQRTAASAAMTGPYVGKLRALWLSAYALGGSCAIDATAR